MFSLFSEVKMVGTTGEVVDIMNSLSRQEGIESKPQVEK